MIENDDFRSGWNYAGQIQGAQVSASVGKAYIEKIIIEIDKLTDQINSYSESKQSYAVLGGFIAEEFHAGSFNIRAVAAESSYRAFVEKSTEQASVDISTNFGNNYSLKYLKDASSSVKAQSKNVLQNYHLYLSSAKLRGTKNPMSLEEYLIKYGYNDDLASLLTSVYNGQGRIIPADQLEEGIIKLRQMIATESARGGEHRLLNLHNYEETLSNLSDRIRSNDGIESIPLTKSEAETIAYLCKSESFKPEDFGITLDSIVFTQYILKQALKGGISAATLSFAIQIVPDLISLIYKLIDEQKIELKSVINNSIKNIASSTKSFIIGFASCSIYLSCKTGKFGASLTSLHAPVIGSMVALMFAVVQDCFDTYRGEKSVEHLRFALTRDLIVTCSSIICGGIAVSLLPIMSSIAFSVGSIIGSVGVSLLTDVCDKTIVSLCVNSGYTLFGIVNQDYKLPISILKQMGLTIKEIDRIKVDYKSVERHNVNRISVKSSSVDRIEITMVKRGMIAFNKIGYI